MRFRIIKKGIHSSWQGPGRLGLGHLGVGRGGAMDRLAAVLANKIAGNPSDANVYEMHFPAPVLEFAEPCLVALTGADFDAKANGKSIPINRKIFLPEGTRLTFQKKVWGERVYLSVVPITGLGSLDQKSFSVEPKNMDVSISKWFINPSIFYKPGPVRVLPGPEFEWLAEASRIQVFQQPFQISSQSNRMGYRLNGEPLQPCRNEELLSSGVLPGTIQLLPNGKPLLLMADCQTTGGYPRILQVIEADLPRLAQMEVGGDVYFKVVTMKEAIQSFRDINDYTAKIIISNY